MRAVEKLVALVRVGVRVLRDGAETEVRAEDVVPGDVVLLSAGGTVAGTAGSWIRKLFSVDEATSRRELPPRPRARATWQMTVPLAGRTNSLLMGTHVVSGTARAVVVRRGRRRSSGGLPSACGFAPLRPFDGERATSGQFRMELTPEWCSRFAFNLFFHRHLPQSVLFSSLWPSA